MKTRTWIVATGAAALVAGAFAFSAFAATPSDPEGTTAQAPAAQQLSSMMDDMGRVMHAMAGQMRDHMDSAMSERMEGRMTTMSDMMRQMAGMMGHRMGSMGSGGGHGMMMMGSDMQMRMSDMHRRMSDLMKECGVETARN